MVTYNLSNRRYTGSKSQLSKWIVDLSLKHCKGNSFLDLFAGTGIVAETASNHYDNITVNDFLPSNHTIYQAFYGKGKFSQNKLDKYIFQFNIIDPNSLTDNYFSINYGSRYFSKDNAKKIGHIRELIENNKDKFTERERVILITSLLYSADKVANTVGHYDAYFKSTKNTGTFIMKPINLNPRKNFKIYCEDANRLVRRISSDIVYIDPPYNSRQYSRFYHVLDNLVTWGKPELFGVARKPAPENMSEYSKTKARDYFEDLINNLDCKYIIVSYNNTYNSKSTSSRNKITLEEIQSILSKKGHTISESIAHKHFNAGNTTFNDHKEFVFITKVR